ncbi:MAG: CHASE2 domain-containing protein [Candidatus Dadabacteria bacterium]|nr:MAG: CHASE2 domain-containing protein [Candidatus Dadabacteria bacterium]
MAGSTRKTVWRGGLLSGGVAGLLGLSLWAMGVFVRPEGWAFDALARWARAGARLPDGVAVVLVDDASLEFMETRVGRWPWPRRVWADVTEFLLMGGARCVVWDILFTEPQGPPGNPDDQALAEATASGPVVHAAQFVRDVPDEVGAALPVDLPESVRERFAWGPAPEGAETANRAYLPIPPILDASWAIGAVDLQPDPDGVYRRVPLWRGWGGWAFPSLGPAALGPSAIPPERPAFGETAVPVDGRGEVLLNPYGDIPAFSISGILASVEALGEGTPLLVDPSEFAGRIVLIGASAAGLEDLKPAPLSPLTPGVFLHATLLGNLLTGDHLRPWPPWASPLVLVLGSLLVAAWTQTARGPVGAGLGGAAAALSLLRPVRASPARNC